MEEKSKLTSLRVIMSGLVMLALILVGFIATLIGVINLRRGMETEVETGVKAACQSYAMVLEYSTENLDELEKNLSNQTGYDYTFLWEILEKDQVSLA